MDNVNRREVPRYRCDLNAELLQPDTGTRRNVTVIILSIKGCCLEGVGPLDQGQKCQLKTQWYGNDLQAEAVVVWNNHQGQAGCRFLSVNDERTKLLREICASLPLQPIILPSEGAN